MTLTIAKLYNTYAAPGDYYDICLLIYQAADHREAASIRHTWQNLIDRVHEETVVHGEPLPYEAVASRVRTLGQRLNLSESFFPIEDLVWLLKKYQFEYQKDIGPETWVVDVMIDLQVPFDTVLGALESIWSNGEAPFAVPVNRKYVSNDILHAVHEWYRRSIRASEVIFGGESNQVAVMEMLKELQTTAGGLSAPRREDCRALAISISRLLD